LKTAGGYLLVLHNLEELKVGDRQVLNLLERAKEERDWELCKELARFLMALDETGNTLKEALEIVGLRPANGGYGDEIGKVTGSLETGSSSVNGLA
jgi:RAB6A-GEF complex partner protein 1